MERVEISISVPLKAAVMNGQGTYGSVIFVPTEEQLQSLSRDERRILLRFVVHGGCEEQGSLRVRSCPADWDGVREALRRMIDNRDHAQRKAEDAMSIMRDRERRTPEVARMLRRIGGYSEGLSDREIVEHEIPAMMEDVREKIIAGGIAPDLIRIVSVESSEWRRMSITVRAEYSIQAANLRSVVEQATMAVVPVEEESLVKTEVMVARVRERSREDGIARRPVTHVIAMLHCVAAASIGVFVRAEAP